VIGGERVAPGDELRKLPLLIALALAVVAVLIELGSPLILGSGDDPPGRGVPYLALVDVVLAYTLLLISLPLIVPDRLQGKLQGIVTLIGSIVLLIVAFLLTLLALAALILMVTLFLAVPFGTAVYAGLFGDFARGEAAALLSLLMALKLALSVCLVLAQQRFLQNKGLVLLVVTSLVATIIVSFLHGLVPGLLVSITDALAAIVVGVIAIVWAIVLLIGSIPAVLRAIKST
jgi:hypothetical protein